MPLLPPDFQGKILVVRRDNIGDLVCTTPFLNGLREGWPGATIAALVNSYNAPVLQGNPAVDRIYAYTKLKHRADGESLLRAAWGRLQLLRELRAEKFDLAVLARPGFDRHGLNFVRWLGIPRILGFVQEGGLTSSLLTDPVAMPDKNTLHEVESVWALMPAIGFSGRPGPLTLYPLPELQRNAPKLSDRSSPVVAVHISAREQSRRLGEGKWIKVIQGLTRLLPHSSLALFWSPGAADDPRHPGDDETARTILEGLDEKTRLSVIPMPTDSLAQLMAGLAGCDLFIGADGGGMHVAVGVGLPTVGLFENSPFKLRHWAPWHVPCEQVPSPTFAIGDTDPEVIVAAALRLLARTRPAS